MQNPKKTIAFIDAANLHKGVESLGWKLDYRRFRRWLREKHGVETAYLFIGLVPKFNDLYTALQRDGYTLVFKETTADGQGNVKGNCDADLVLWAVRASYEGEFEKAVIVTSDGDYACLVKFLLEKGKLAAVVSPSDKCSILIKRTNAPITYVRGLRNRLENAQK